MCSYGNRGQLTAKRGCGVVSMMALFVCDARGQVTHVLAPEPQLNKLIGFVYEDDGQQ